MKWLSKALVSKDHEQQLVEAWFANSADLADLERRQRMLERGQAPWQTHANHSLRGWF